MSDYNSLAPLTPDDQAHYLIQDPLQLQHLLVQLAKHPEIVCLYPPRRREPFALSALLEVGTDHLIFDASPDPQTQALLLAAPTMICVSSLARVHIQFEVLQPLAVLHDGRPAIRTQRPDHVYYMQRRDYYRLPVPAHESVHCHIAQSSQLIEAEVADISLGGISLIGPLPGLHLQPGMRLEGCHLHLPPEIIVPVDLLVCTSRDLGTRGGRRNLRIGCRFAQLNGAAQTQLQRFINRLDRARIALS